MASFLTASDKSRLKSLSAIGYRFYLTKTQFIDVFKNKDTGDTVTMERVRPCNGQYRFGNHAFVCIDTTYGL